MIKIINSLDDLESDVWAVLRVDPNTGVPLNEQFEWAQSGDAAFYCFSSMEDARTYALQQLSKNKLTEWCLFDPNGTQVETINDPEALIENIPKKKGLFEKMMDLFRRKR
nr:hypothetical protein [uncultured Desulfobacter sp.]